MVDFEEEKRPKNIEEILKDEWFGQIKKLNKDQKMILEEQMRLDFEKRESQINLKTKFEVSVNLEKREFEKKQKKLFWKRYKYKIN